MPNLVVYHILCEWIYLAPAIYPIHGTFMVHEWSLSDNILQKEESSTLKEFYVQVWMIHVEEEKGKHGLEDIVYRMWGC